jgi:divalent metal cation (Fe/Co/Zn/Cd) transporter
MQKKKQKKVEKKSLIVSTIVNLIIAAAGIRAFAASSVQALFIDCFSHL